MRPSDPDLEDQHNKEPYEKFMYQHLQYYGYFRDEGNTLQNPISVPERRKISSCLKPDNFDKRNRSEHNSDKNSSNSPMTEKSFLKSKQVTHDHLEEPYVLRLREPRNLFPISNSKDSILSSFWPIECEVIEDSVRHIEWVPPEPEPFYQPTGNEFAPIVVGEDCGTVVYSIDPATQGTCFTGSRIGVSREPIKSVAVSLRDTEDTTLLFESRFESGNLQKAVRV